MWNRLKEGKGGLTGHLLTLKIESTQLADLKSCTICGKLVCGVTTGGSPSLIFSKLLGHYWHVSYFQEFGTRM